MATKQITRNITLPPQLDKLVRSKIDSGEYESISEVVSDGLRLLELRDSERKDEIARIRSQIEVGLKDIENGDVLDGPSVFEEIRQLSKVRRKQMRRSR